MLWARMLAYITGTVHQELLLRNEYLATENRILRAQIKKPKQAFLDWLHAADRTSHELTSWDLVREPTTYLIPECDASLILEFD